MSNCCRIYETYLECYYVEKWKKNDWLLYTLFISIITKNRLYLAPKVNFESSAAPWAVNLSSYNFTVNPKMMKNTILFCIYKHLRERLHLYTSRTHCFGTYPWYVVRVLCECVGGGGGLRAVPIIATGSCQYSGTRFATARPFPDSPLSAPPASGFCW